MQYYSKTYIDSVDDMHTLLLGSLPLMLAYVTLTLDWDYYC